MKSGGGRNPGLESSATVQFTGEHGTCFVVKLGKVPCWVSNYLGRAELELIEYVGVGREDALTGK